MDNSNKKTAPIAVTPENLSPRIVICYYFILRPGFNSSNYRTPAITLLFIIDGEINYSCARGSGLAGKGDLVCFSPGQTYYEVIGKKPLLSYSVTFYPSFGEWESGIPFLEGVGWLPTITRIGEETAPFEKIYNRLIKVMEEQRVSWPLESSALITELVRMVFENNAGVATSDKQIDRWGHLLTSLDNNLEERKVNELARDFGLSTEQFIRSFAKRTGKTPKQYIIQRRLEKAKNLILSGVGIKEAAYESGFNCPRYFSRIYKKHFGYSPSATPKENFTGLPVSPGGIPEDCHFIWAPGYSHQTFIG